MTVPVKELEFALNIGKKIASLFNGKVSPNHWKGWRALDDKIGAPRGTNAINWVINDGDSVQSEALNIVSYMNSIDETGSKGILEMLGYSTWFKREITVNDIANKLKKGGFPIEAQALLAEANNAAANNISRGNILTQAKALLPSASTNPLSSLNESAPTYKTGSEPTKANIFSNIWMTLAIVGAAIAIFFGFKNSGNKRRYR